MENHIKIRTRIKYIIYFDKSFIHHYLLVVFYRVVDASNHSFKCFCELIGSTILAQLLRQNKKKDNSLKFNTIQLQRYFSLNSLPKLISNVVNYPIVTLHSALYLRDRNTIGIFVVIESCNQLCLTPCG